MQNMRVVISGGGPAGLTAAYELSKKGVESVVLEKDQILGGLARTVSYKGYHFDIGGHRFFTKVRAVEDMWAEVLKDDLLECNRLSRIYYNKKFFYYPLRPSNALWGLGIWNSILIVLSYLRARVFPRYPEETFEDWVCNRFGKRLYRIFFKTYTEKVWGIPCNEIRAEWAAQRIKGLSLISALKNALLKPQNGGRKEGVIKTLIDSFHYPKYGPGMMWQTVAQIVQKYGCEVRLGAEVDEILWQPDRITGLRVRINGNTEIEEGTHFISSMPIRELIQRFRPAAPDHIIQAAESLRYRDFLTIAVIVNKKELFPDNWIYIHDPEVKVGRIQNFKNWSPYMVPDPNKTCLGLEYFCFEGDGLWTMSDEDLLDLAKKELHALGLVDAKDVEDGKVLRVPKAYPVYDSSYLDALQTIRDFLAPISNLQLVGRNGMHKYNNQDHSMFTAMLAARNILGARYDLWMVNADPEYHEELKDTGTADEFARLEAAQPHVPSAISPADEVLIRTFAKMDKLAFATAVGAVSGLAVFFATLVLILKGGPNVGANLSLLREYFTGYSVTVKGAFIGLGYSFFSGFLFGWLFAYLRNFLVALMVISLRRRAESPSLRNFMDYI